VIPVGNYSPAVTLDQEKCKGCTNCIKSCPTEAIRVRNGKAIIIENLCIDCGECIRNCPNHAKIVAADSLDRLKEFKYNIVLPAPTLYGQFRRGISPARVLAAVLSLGFDEIYEVSLGADAVTIAIREYLRDHKSPRPMIASACPGVVRLIQVRFPSLVNQIIPIESPMEIAAKMVKQKRSLQLGLQPEEIGIFFITPCPAKVNAIRQPLGVSRSCVDGAIAINAIYADLLKQIHRVPEMPELLKGTGLGIGWARAGGQNYAIGIDNELCVDGIHNVINVLTEIELGKVNDDIDYLGFLACSGGCVGGPLTVDNPFGSRVKIRNLAAKMPQDVPPEFEAEVKRLYQEGFFEFEHGIEPRSYRLDDNISQAIIKVEKSERILKELPGLDCGSCGSPTCRSLAEDISCGGALETDCTFKLREILQELAAQMLALAKLVPPVTAVQKEIMKIQRQMFQLAEQVPPVMEKKEERGEAE